MPPSTLPLTTSLSADEAAAVAAVDVPALEQLLAELVAVPSVTGSDAESELLHALSRRLEEMDLTVDHWRIDLDDLVARPDFPGTEVARTEAWGLAAITPERDGPTVVLEGHVDVVPPGDASRWTSEPFRPQLVGRSMLGRGTCDMKGGVVASLTALQGIRAAGVELPGRLALHLVGGEEDGGLGAFATLKRGHGGDVCIIPEPTSGTLIPAAGGSLTFTLDVPGEPTHASTRWAGRSAIDHYVLVHRALAELERQRNLDPDPLMAEYPIPHTLSVGILHAGDWASTVPERLVAQGRLGVRLDEDPAVTRASLLDCVAALNDGHAYLRDHPVQVAWTGGQFGAGRCPPGHPLLDVVGDAHEGVTGHRLRQRGAPYGSDLRLYTAAGIPTVHFGPGDVRHAHAVDECVDLDEVAEVARTLVVAVLRLLRRDDLAG